MSSKAGLLVNENGDTLFADSSLTLKATLEAAVTVDTILTNVDLYSADLSGINLQGGTMGPRMAKAVLYAANLTGAVVSSAGKPANLEGASFYAAKCTSADFTSANLNRTDCQSSDFTGATTTNMTRAQANLSNAIALV